MERIYAFTDESGAFGWDLENENVSTHFLITAILVEESDLYSLKTSVEAIRKKYFHALQGSENPVLPTVCGQTTASADSPI